ncbi:substrate-binding domain-containing protein [Gluconobacter kondonii]
MLKHGMQNHAARAFFTYLQGAQARAIITSYGYDMP